jgi:hypothetical protein
LTPERITLSFAPGEKTLCTVCFHGNNIVF